MRNLLCWNQKWIDQHKDKSFAAIGKACLQSAGIREPSDAKRYRRQDISSAEDRKVRPEPIEGAGCPSRALLFPGCAPEPLWTEPGNRGGGGGVKMAMRPREYGSIQITFSQCVRATWYLKIGPKSLARSLASSTSDENGFQFQMINTLT